MGTGPEGVGDGTYTATPVYAAVRKTPSSDQLEASAPAVGGSPSPRVVSLYPDTTLIENDLYE